MDIKNNSKDNDQLDSKKLNNNEIKEENLIINKNYYDKTTQKLGNYEKLEHKKIELIT